MNHPIPVWPGGLVSLPGGDVYVRSAPADTAGSATMRTEHAVFVHGLGGSATNWTDLMDLLRRPAHGVQAGGGQAGGGHAYSAQAGGGQPGGGQPGAGQAGGGHAHSAQAGGGQPGGGQPGDGQPGAGQAGGGHAHSAQAGGAQAGGGQPGGGQAGGGLAHGVQAGGGQPGGAPVAVPALAGQAVDLPGFGFSPVPADGDYSIDAKARIVIELIEHYRRWPVHLVGNSLGGSVAVRVAARRPDLVKTLTLVSPALPDLLPRVIPLRVSVLCVPGVAEWVMRRLDRHTAESRTLGTIQEVYSDPGLMHPLRYAEEAAEVQRRDELDYVHQVMIGSARGLVREYLRPGPLSLWRDAGRVTAPTLVLYGSHDRLVRAAMASKAARAFPAARVLVLPRMGHVAMMERPELVAAAMWDLLASVAGRAGKTTETDEKRSAPQHAATQADTGAAG